MAQKRKKTTAKKPSTKKKPKSVNKKKKSSKSALDFDKIWKEYDLALDAWKESLAVWHKATNDVLTMYNHACKEAIGKDSELLKKINVSWENTWASIGPEYMKQQNELWENVFKKTNLSTIQKFNEQWKKYLTTSGNDSLKAYGEAMKYFNKVWDSTKA